MAEQASRDDRFVEWLEGLRDREDRASLAALRGGLRKPPGAAMGMYPLVMPFISPGDSVWSEKCYFLVASLFALHPTPGGKGSMGEAMSKVALKAESDSVEQRFVALLSSHRDDLPGRLRHAVALARSKEVPVDWRQLLRDIKAWDLYEFRVQRRWGRDYWGTTTAQLEQEAKKESGEDSHEG